MLAQVGDFRIGTRFYSQRCRFSPFGFVGEERHLFALHPVLKEAMARSSMEAVLKPSGDLRVVLAGALTQLEEFHSYKAIHEDPTFFFAAFSQTGTKKDSSGKVQHFTNDEDIQSFIAERLHNLLNPTNQNHEFVVRNHGGTVVGYAELFDRQIVDGKVQYERGLFIDPRHQGGGLGKEVILALTDYAFQNLGVDQIFTMVDPNNVRSLNNIEKNSGAVTIGEEESKYGHLSGGGTRRRKYLICPENFYRAVADRGNEELLCQKVQTPALPSPSEGGRRKSLQAHLL